MSRTAHILGVIALVVSALFLPSWSTVIVAVLLIALWRSYVPVLLTAVLMDVTFGAPVSAFGGFAFFYSAIFAILVLSAVMLDKQLIE